jgi:hypothetical protein
MKMSEDTTIYISYAGDTSPNGADTLVREISKKLNAYNVIEYKIMSDGGKRYSINQLIEDIGKNPYVITVISERYLTGSIYCQLEIMRLVQNANITNRIFPVFVKDLPDVFDVKTKNDMIHNARRYIENILETSSYDIEEKRDIGAAYNTIKKFITMISDQNNMSFFHNQIDDLVEKIETVIHEDGKQKKNLYASVPAVQPGHVSRDIHADKIFEKLLDKEIKRVGIWGMGGIGKTSFAIEIANREKREKNFRDGVYFVSLGQNPDISTIIGDLLILLDEESDSPSLVKLQKAFERLNALLIIDNVWDIKHLKNLEINAEYSKVLITTRSRRVLKSFRAEEYNLTTMSEEESFKILEQKVGEINDQCRPIAKELLKKSGYLPLAIDIMGSMIEERGSEDLKVWQRVLDRLQKAKLDKLEVENGNEEHENLFKVIDLSVEYLKPDIKERYLEFKIFNTYNYITKATIESYMDEDDVYDTVSALESASLLVKKIDINRNVEKYQLHDLQKYYIEKVGGETEKIYANICHRYIEKYSGKWYEIDSNNAFFFQHYTDLCNSINRPELILEIAKSILFQKDNLSIGHIKNAINILNKDEKEVAKQLLYKKNNHPTTEMWILKKLGSHDSEAVKYAKEYITDNNYAAMQTHIVLTCLNILEDSCVDNINIVNEFALRYLKNDTQSLSSHIALACLKIVSNNNSENKIILKQFAERYMKMNFEYYDSALVFHCLNILGKDHKVFEKFKTYIAEYGVYQVNSLFQEIYFSLLNEEESKRYAQKYLEKDFTSLHSNMIWKSVQKLDSFNSVITGFARKYLDSASNTLNVNSVKACIRIIGEKDNKIFIFAEKYMSQDFEDIKPPIAGICIDILEKRNELVKKYAEQYLKTDFDEMNKYVTAKCISCLDPENSDSIRFVEKYLQQNIKDINNSNSYVVIAVLEALEKNNSIRTDFAERYIAQDHSSINPGIVRYCLDSVNKRNKDAISYAEYYLKENIETLKNYIVPKALKILDKGNKVAYTYSEQYMRNVFDEINPVIAQYCLSRLGKKNRDATNYAQKYLQLDTEKLNEYVIPDILKVLDKHNVVAKEYAESYIQSAYDASNHKINDHILKASLFLLGSNNYIARNYAEKYLKEHMDMHEINTYIAKECVFILRWQYNNTAKKFCKKYLSQPEAKMDINVKKQSELLLSQYHKLEKENS